MEKITPSKTNKIKVKYFLPPSLLCHKNSSFFCHFLANTPVVLLLQQTFGRLEVSRNVQTQLLQKSFHFSKCKGPNIKISRKVEHNEVYQETSWCWRKKEPWSHRSDLIFSVLKLLVHILWISKRRTSVSYQMGGSTLLKTTTNNLSVFVQKNKT